MPPASREDQDTSPTSTHSSLTKKMREGLIAQQRMKRLSERDEVEKVAAMDRDKELHAVLKLICKIPDNRHCADCGAPFAFWASMPHGVFLCVHCAQLHRRFSHISSVKDAMSGTFTWYEDEVNVMKKNGNRVANAILLEKHPAGPAFRMDPAATDEVKLRFLQSKYELRLWAAHAYDILNSGHHRRRSAPAMQHERASGTPARLAAASKAPPPMYLESPLQGVAVPPGALLVSPRARRASTAIGTGLSKAAVAAVVQRGSDHHLRYGGKGDRGLKDFFAAWGL